jgi:zinc D-Ala-D-Ala carboxypeptidase
MRKNISPHITYAEATKSRTATANGITWNHPNDEQLLNMERVANECFEPLRNHFNKPIAVTSFFRCERLNSLVGGVKNSDHLTGCAMDIDSDVYGGMTNLQIMTWLYNNVDYDQLIFEYLEWVHVSKRPKGNRKETLQIRAVNGIVKREEWRP